MNKDDLKAVKIVAFGLGVAVAIVLFWFFAFIY
jgi:hypothetical protein